MTRGSFYALCIRPRPRGMGNLFKIGWQPGASAWVFHPVCLQTASKATQIRPGSVLGFELLLFFSKVWCNNFAFVSATICITSASQGHFERHESTGDWRWVDPAWSSEWQPASSEAHDVGGPGRGKGSGAKSVDGSAAAARAAMTLEEATEWAAELTATSSQTAKCASPVVANDGMPRFVELPKAGLGLEHVAPSPTAKGVPLPSPAEAPAEWQGPISPFSPKKREPEKCREAAKSKKEKKIDDQWSAQRREKKVLTSGQIGCDIFWAICFYNFRVFCTGSLNSSVPSEVLLGRWFFLPFPLMLWRAGHVAVQLLSSLWPYPRWMSRTRKPKIFWCRCTKSWINPGSCQCTLPGST